MRATTVPEITTDQLSRINARGAVVIDVRELHEYLAGHVPGVLPVPMGQLPSRLNDLDSTQPVYLICATGNRSAVMAELLIRAGFDAYSVAGGTVDWQQGGRDIEAGPPVPADLHRNEKSTDPTGDTR